ncbi:MAG: hypothetical protein CL793_06495 [Chloroflexi bacterium]|nr:hypothetical protein [Chloroflexota bacterium]|tara:strand:+ start:506 stop:742 length:237 start_codon:yes stop_codon:yes gene_type:complete
MKKISLLDQAIRCKNPYAAVAISDKMERIGLNYHEQFAYLKSKYPDLTLAEWDGLLYAGEHDSELRNYDIFTKFRRKK